MSQIITSKPSNPSRKAAPGRSSWAGLCLAELCPDRRTSAQHAAPAASAGTDLQQYQTARFSKHCWHVLTDLGDERAQKFPLAWARNNLLAQGEPEKGEADHWSASLTPGKKQAQQHQPGVWTANPEWQAAWESARNSQHRVLSYLYLHICHPPNYHACQTLQSHLVVQHYPFLMQWFAPSTSALDRSGQGDKLVQKLPQTLKPLLINMTNTATKPLALRDASLSQFPSSCLVTSPHNCSHCPFHHARLSPGLSKTSQLQIQTNSYSNGRTYSKSPCKSCCLLIGIHSRVRTVGFAKIFWQPQKVSL